jgi:hypothetical protein
MEETYLILKEELLPQLEEFVDKRFGSTSLK